MKIHGIASDLPFGGQILSGRGDRRSMRRLLEECIENIDIGGPR